MLLPLPLRWPFSRRQAAPAPAAVSVCPTCERVLDHPRICWRCSETAAPTALPLFQLTALEQAWADLYDDPATCETAEAHAAFLTVTLNDVAHLEGALHRPFPTTRPEVRS